MSNREPLGKFSALLSTVDIVPPLECKGHICLDVPIPKKPGKLAVGTATLCYHTPLILSQCGGK